MRRNILARLLVTAALLIVALPVAASAQYYRDYRDRYYDRSDRQDVRMALNRLDNASARLQGDVSAGRERRVLGGIFSFRTVDTTAIDQVRDFRRAVRDLRASSRNGFALNDSINEARVVLDRGVDLDRYLRLRTGRASVDADLADIRSNLHIIADAYGLSMPY